MRHECASTAEVTFASIAGQYSFLLEPQCLLIVDNWAAMCTWIGGALGRTYWIGAKAVRGPVRISTDARIALPYPGVSAWAGETAEHVGGG